MSQMQRRIASLKISLEEAIAEARAEAVRSERRASTIETRNACDGAGGDALASVAASVWGSQVIST